MPNYKEMYLKLFSATEDAINQLIATQRACEEICLADDSDDVPADTPIAERVKND